MATLETLSQGLISCRDDKVKDLEGRIYLLHFPRNRNYAQPTFVAERKSHVIRFCVRFGLRPRQNFVPTDVRRSHGRGKPDSYKASNP